MTVGNKMPWDYKQRGWTLEDTGKLGSSAFTDFANFNFGATGAAWGIPLNVLQRGAGYAQEVANASTPEWGHWYQGPRMGTTQTIKTKSARGISTTKMAAISKSSLSLMLACNLVWLLSCNPCSDTPRSKAVSPDGRLVANICERNCGATTDFSSMVNVQSTSDKFRAEEGLLFVAKGRYDLSVAWTGPRTLVISCATCSRRNVFREVVALGDIDVRYSLGPQH